MSINRVELITFTLTGVANVALTAYIIGKAPDSMPLFFTIKAIVMLSLRLYVNQNFLQYINLTCPPLRVKVSLQKEEDALLSFRFLLLCKCIGINLHPLDAPKRNALPDNLGFQ